MKNKFILPIIVFTLFIAFAVSKSYLDEKSRLKNFDYKKAKVISIEKFRTAGGDIFIGYEFELNNNKKYTSKVSIKCAKENITLIQELLLNKLLIVFYEKDNPSNNELGLKQSTFKKYNIPLPNDNLILIDSIESICNSSR